MSSTVQSIDPRNCLHLFFLQHTPSISFTASGDLNFNLLILTYSHLLTNSLFYCAYCNNFRCGKRLCASEKRSQLHILTRLSLNQESKERRFASRDHGCHKTSKNREHFLHALLNFEGSCLCLALFGSSKAKA